MKATTEKLFRAKVWRDRIVDRHTGEREQFLKSIPANEVTKVDIARGVHCDCCEAKVRFHPEKTAKSQRAHTEHFTREQSEKCPSGMYYKPVQQQEPLNVKT